MRKTHISDIFILLIGLLSGFNLPASSQTLYELREQVSCNPQKALAILDSLQQEAVYPSYKLNYLRACAHFSLAMYTSSLESGKLVLESSEITSDTILCKHTYMLLAESAVFAYSLEDAVYYIIEGKKYADRIGDDVLLANLCLTEGEVYRRIGLNNKGYECILKSTSLLKNKTAGADLYQLSHAYGFLMSYYIQDNKFLEAWQVGSERWRVLERMRQNRANPYMYDNQLGYYYSKMAYLASLMKKDAEASAYYDAFMKTHLASTYAGKIELCDYLLSVKRYDEVLTYAHAYFKAMDKRDTLNLSYTRMLQQTSLAYEMQGAYRNAYLVVKRRLAIQKDMRLHNERNHLFEVAELSRAVHNEEKLLKTESKLANREHWLFSLGVLSALLLLLVAGLIRKQRTIRQGQRKLAELILENEDQKRQLNAAVSTLSASENQSKSGGSVKSAPVSNKADKGTGSKSGALTDMSDEVVFHRFAHRVCEEKLYLDYQLTRDDYARLMRVDKNRFATILREQAGVNLATYLNSLRLEYSVSLFRQYPDWPIEKVAEQSALPNLSTFYRLFKEKYGMSPSVFRKRI